MLPEPSSEKTTSIGELAATAGHRGWEPRQQPCEHRQNHVRAHRLAARDLLDSPCTPPFHSPSSRAVRRRLLTVYCQTTPLGGRGTIELSNSWRRTLPCILVGAILCALGGCGDEKPAVTTSGTPNPAQPRRPSWAYRPQHRQRRRSRRRPPLRCPPLRRQRRPVPPGSPAGGLSGVVIRRSDVASEPHQAITAGAVVIVPDDPPPRSGRL